MLEVPPHFSAVEGFKIEVIADPTNIASGAGGQGGHLVDDGFLKVLIINDGSNPFWPEAYESEAVVVRLLNTNEPPPVISEIDICILGADDSPVRIHLIEEVIGNRFGIWMVIDCESPLATGKNEFLAHQLLIDEPHHA